MAKRPWLPIALSVVGFGGLLASTACFPPIPLAGGPSNPSGIMRPQPGTNDSPSPEGSPPASASPSASPAGFGDLAPQVGRTYVYRTTGAAAGELRVAVTAIAGDKVTYRSESAPAAGSPPPARTGEVTPANGVYWVFPERPNPVTAAIASYPTEAVTVPAGTASAAKVAAGTEAYWFVGGIIVKAVTAAGLTELVELK